MVINEIPVMMLKLTTLWQHSAVSYLPLSETHLLHLLFSVGKFITTKKWPPSVKGFEPPILAPSWAVHPERPANSGQA